MGTFPAGVDPVGAQSRPGYEQRQRWFGARLPSMLPVKDAPSSLRTGAMGGSPPSNTSMVCGTEAGQHQRDGDAGRFTRCVY